MLAVCLTFVRNGHLDLRLERLKQQWREGPVEYRLSPCGAR